MTTMQERDWVVSGKLTLAAMSVAAGGPFGGIKVCSLVECVKTDSQGSYTLHVKGRGFPPIWLDADEWLHWLNLPRPAPYHVPHAPGQATYLDVEGKVPPTWNPRIVIFYSVQE